MIGDKIYGRKIIRVESGRRVARGVIDCSEKLTSPDAFAQSVIEGNDFSIS